MLQIIPSNIKPSDFHSYMVGAIAPRPIAFVSSSDQMGGINLSPFSFYNAFGSNPPLIIFSPALRGKDGGVKNTLENAREVDEVVINVVNYAMVQQMSLASTEYPKGVDEFVKSGFTAIPSELVKPPRVKESPVQMECKVKQIIQTGVKGGAANLVICEIVLMHINEDILNDKGIIDPYKIDQVARLGGNWYTRASKGLFEVPKPLKTLGIGVDALPESVRTSKILTGNDLGMLGNIEKLPEEEQQLLYENRTDVKIFFSVLAGDPENLTNEVHLEAHKLLSDNNITEAWMLLIAHQKK